MLIDDSMAGSHRPVYLTCLKAGYWA